jgi:hypothetical protein
MLSAAPQTSLTVAKSDEMLTCDGKGRLLFYGRRHLPGPAGSATGQRDLTAARAGAAPVRPARTRVTLCVSPVDLTRSG